MTAYNIGRLLIVDDEIELMSAIREALVSQGYDAVGLASAQEALKLLETETFDLLLSDLMMPEMDGISLLQGALKIDARLIGIIMTGQGTIQTAVDAMKVGAYDYVLKPFKLNALLPLLARAMEVRRLRQENVELRDSLAVHELARTVALTLDAEQIVGTVADAAMRQFGADDLLILLGREVAAVRGEAKIPESMEKLISPRQLRIPMMAGGKTVGLMCLSAVTRRPFSESEVKAVGVLCSTTAAALESAAAQQQLVRQERLRALGEMASGVAHDFNNSLSAILGFTETMLMFPDDLGDRERITECLTTIQTIAQDAAGLVDRLRAFYRPRDEAEVLQPVDLNALVDQAVSFTAPKWRGRAQVATELGPLPSIGVHDGEMRQVLTNLLFNAVDAMPEGGTITIRTAVDTDCVMLEVSDTGIGMTEETRARCLEPFYTTKGSQGTGLGLAMVYGMVQRHHGLIELDSEWGRGTTIRLRLPLTREAHV
ncbi:MAG: sensor histidine kinase [Candidatus Xenobia bacterium]